MKKPDEVVAVMLLTLVIAFGCERLPPSPPPPMNRDGLGTDLGETCAALRNKGCPEGEPVRADETCYEHLVKVERRTVIPTACVRNAATREILRECGDKSTLRFRCKTQ